MENLTITKVFISDKRKDGTPFKDKNGKPFWKIGVKFHEYGEEWFSCLAFSPDDRAMQLKEGDTVHVVLTEENGYKNFKMPTKLDMLTVRVEALEQWRKSQQPDFKVQEQAEKERKELDEINPDDIPF